MMKRKRERETKRRGVLKEREQNESVATMPHLNGRNTSKKNICEGQREKKSWLWGERG